MKSLSTTIRCSGSVILIATALAAFQAQAQWIGLGAGGSGNIFSDTANWTGDTINGDFGFLAPGVDNGTIVFTNDFSGTLGASWMFYTAQASAIVTFDSDVAGVTRKLTLGDDFTVTKASLAAGAYGTTNSVRFTTNMVVDVNAGSDSNNRTFGLASGGGGKAGIIFNSKITGTGGAFFDGGVNELNNQSNDFTGAFSQFNLGSTKIKSIANKGVPSPLGLGTNASPQISLNNGTLMLSGASSAQSSDRDISVGNTGIIQNNSSATLSLSGKVVNQNGTSSTLDLAGSNTGANTISGYVADNATNNLGLRKDDAGLWIINNPTNSFSGVVALFGGTLQFNSLAASGQPSSLGSGSNSVLPAIKINNSTLTMQGAIANQSSDRVIWIANTGTLKNNDASYALNLSGVVQPDTSTSGTLVLGGTSPATNVISGLMSNNAANVLTLQKADSGIWWLTNPANSYNGLVQTLGGTLIFSSLANKGVNSSLGVGRATSPQLKINNSTLLMKGASGPQSTDKDTWIANTGALGNDDANYMLTVNGFIRGDAGTSGTLALTGSNTGDNTVNGYMANNDTTPGNILVVTKTGNGTWVIANNTNAFTGRVGVNGGTLKFTSIANKGAISALGVGTSLLASWQVGMNNGTLTMVSAPADQSTDRDFQIVNTGGLKNNDPLHSLTLTGTVKGDYGSSTAGNFQLGGSNTMNNSVSCVIANNTSSTVSVSKVDSGTWILSAANTYSGSTTISGGRLLINGSTAASSSVTINSGGTLGGTGVINGQLAVNAGGTLSPGASIGTLTVNSNLTIAGNLFIEVNRSVSPSNDVTIVSGILTNAGTGTVTVTNLGGTALAAGNKFTLFNKPVQNGGAMTVTGVLPAGLAWANNLGVDGSVSVVISAPPVLNYTVSGGNTLNFSWTGTGAKLQSQTNLLTKGLSTNWFDYPGGASSPVSVTMDPAKGSVFFRLAIP